MTFRRCKCGATTINWFAIVPMMVYLGLPWRLAPGAGATALRRAPHVDEGGFTLEAMSVLGDHFYTISETERDNAVTSFGYSGEGVACNIYSQPRPLQRGDHLYTTSMAELNDVVAYLGYRDEGIACYVLPSGSVPLYRLQNLTVWDSFYTTSALERDNAAGYGYQYVGITAYVLPAPQRGAVPLFRLRSLVTGDHFYTRSTQERDNAVAAYHYVLEGIACYVYATAGPGRVPLFRAYKASDVLATVPLLRLLNGNGDHFYTLDEAESQNAIHRFGYHLEGVAGYVLSKGVGPPFGIPLYRLLHPNNGDHFYTISLIERNNAIAHFSYTDEGIACGVLYPFERPAVGVATPLYRLLKTRAPAAQPTSPGPNLTCDGKPVTAATHGFIFVAQDNASKRLYPTPVSVQANSQADAQVCAQRMIDSAAAGATAVPVESLKTFYFGVHGPGECFTEQLPNTSSSDAETALRFSVCSNCTYVDITDEVTNPDGSIEEAVLDNWCANHPQ